MERGALVEQTDYQDIDALMQAKARTESFLVAHLSIFELHILVGPYGMMTLQTTIYAAIGQDPCKNNC